MMMMIIVIIECIKKLLFFQLHHANAQLIVPLETFRKEQIGGAKVPYTRQHLKVQKCKNI